MRRRCRAALRSGTAARGERATLVAPPGAPRDRTGRFAGAFPHREPPGRGRHGGRLPRLRHQAAANGRLKSTAAGIRRRFRLETEADAGSPRCVRVESSEYRHGVRNRIRRRRRFHLDGVCRGPAALADDQRKTAHPARGAPLRHLDCRRPGDGACGRGDPPGLEARQHHGHAGWTHQTAGLRPGAPGAIGGWRDRHCH